VAAVGPAVVAGSSPAGRALVVGLGARLEAPGRSFHIGGSSSKWIYARTRLPAVGDLGAGRLADFGAKQEKNARGANFAARPSKEKPMRVCIFGVGAIGSYIAGHLGSRPEGHDTSAGSSSIRACSNGRSLGPERAIGSVYRVGAEVSGGRADRGDIFGDLPTGPRLRDHRAHDDGGTNALGVIRPQPTEKRIALTLAARERHAARPHARPTARDRRTGLLHRRDAQPGRFHDPTIDMVLDLARAASEKADPNANPATADRWPDPRDRGSTVVGSVLM
jgi:hypothetical protein